MELTTVLNNKLLDLPKNRNDKSFPTFVKETLSEYIELTRSIDNYDNDNEYKISSEEIHSLIEKVSQAIIESVNSYYDGYPFNAYQSIANLLDNATCLEDNILAKILNQIFTYDLGKLYRTRIANPNKDFSKEEMFHIPFNLREKSVKTQRYSIPGLPCLYLSNSVYVTWEELNRPDLNEIHTVRLEASDHDFLQLIDLKHPNELRSKYDSANIDMKLLDYIITWPIVFACSIKTENKENNFKPEYIIPQILLQYVSKNIDYHGIKYFSNNIDYSKKNAGVFYNVAIPVLERKENGFCRILKKAFKMTESVSLQKITAASGGQTSMYLSGEVYNDEIHTVEIIKGKPRPFCESIFHEMEAQLTFLEAKRIDF